MNTHSYLGFSIEVLSKADADGNTYYGYRITDGGLLDAIQPGDLIADEEQVLEHAKDFIREYLAAGDKREFWQATGI